MKKILKTIIISIMVIFIYIILNGASIYSYSMYDNVQKSDVIIVLGAGSYNDKLSPVFKSRIDHSIDLYKQGYSNKIIYTGGKGTGNKSTDAHAAYVYAINKGVNKEDIILEDKSTITLENISNSKAIMNNYGFKDAIIVSDPMHMKRAIFLCKMNNIKAYSSPTPTSQYKTLNTKIPFLINETCYYIGYKFLYFLSIFN